MSEDREEFLSSVTAEVRDCFDSLTTSQSPDDADDLFGECAERVADLAEAWCEATDESMKELLEQWLYTWDNDGVYPVNETRALLSSLAAVSPLTDAPKEPT